MTQHNSLAMTLIGVALLSLLIVVLIPTSSLHAAMVSTRVAITKVASLSVEKLDTDHLYHIEGDSNMTFTACLKAGGDSIPYRVSASSLNHPDTFAVRSHRSDEQVPYQVIWSNGEASYALKNQQDITGVQQLNSERSCDFNSVSVVIDDKLFSVASNARYIDTLSVIFVIE